ncbi:hypothetical protein FRX31_004338 [Thalictrum thalictroides]|uniref:Uncharacterized protein n=1 Tax=Thalictrum thalictroides TaxID=46969 RepID=A0A7J6X9E0_THATH|nr:hypothetical protein FRX31_004338 [Thalictrum thalictroides]
MGNDNGGNQIPFSNKFVILEPEMELEEGLQGQEEVGMDQVPDIEIVLDTPLSQALVVALDNHEDELISAPQVEDDIQQYEKENEFFLENQADSEEEIESVEEDKEPEYFKDHLSPKCIVMEAKRAARGKGVVVNTNKREAKKGDTQKVSAKRSLIPSPNLRMTKARQKGLGKEGLSKSVAR